jgi:hypothetical protein
LNPLADYGEASYTSLRSTSHKMEIFTVVMFFDSHSQRKTCKNIIFFYDFSPCTISALDGANVASASHVRTLAKFLL